MEKPHIKYPCFWTYALVGNDEEELRLLIGQVARGTNHRVSFSKISAGKRYASLHVDIEVASEEERDRYFEAFQSDPRVKFIL